MSKTKYIEGVGSSPDNALSKLMVYVEKELHARDVGEVETMNKNGDVIDYDLFCKRGGLFSFPVTSGKDVYLVDGVVYKKGKKWIASGNIAQYEF